MKVFRGLQFETDAEIGQIGHLWMDTTRLGPGLIKAIAGEDWVIERRPDGKLCFVLYCTTFFHSLPGSATIVL